MTHHPPQPVDQRLGTSWLRREDGVESLEVALIGALIVVIILMAVPLLEPGIIQAFTDVTSAIQNPEAQLE